MFSREVKASARWDQDWLLEAQEELYDRCRSLVGKECEETASHFFLPDSMPYLMATEHPWACLDGEDIKDRSVLTVAGSGDLPFFFRSLGAEPLAAVDISRPACILNELKQAALQHFEWEDYLLFFLADIERASDFLRDMGLPDSLPPRERIRLYQELRPDLSPQAAAFWDRHFSGGNDEVSSFGPFVRSSALFCLHEIPYLRDSRCYAGWRAAFKPYALLNLPLDDALASCEARFDILYLSNVLEYSRNSFLMEGSASGYRRYLEGFLENAACVIEPSGLLFVYAFEDIHSSTFKTLIEDLEPLTSLGFDFSARSIKYSSPLIPGSVFRNTLLRFQKKGVGS